MIVTIQWLVFIVLVVTLPTQLWAQEKDSRVGRLPSGEAYRVDEQGYKIVDHLAELEVTVDDLRRQMGALEGELEDKQQKLERLESGDEKTEFSEETTVKSDEFRAPTVSQTAGSSQLRARNPDCELVTSALRQRINHLEQQEARAVAPQAGGNDSEEILRLRNHISQLQEALMETPSQERFQSEQSTRKKLEQAQTNLRQQVGRQSQEIERLERELAQKESRLASAQTSEQISTLETELSAKVERERQLAQKVTTLSNQIGQLEGALERYARLQRESYHSGRAALRSSTGVPMISSDNPQRSRPHMTPTGAEYDKASVARAQSDFNAKISKINVLIGKRKRLLEGLKNQNKKVTVNGRPLVARNGQSFELIQQSVKDLNTRSNLSAIRSGLIEIESILIGDIKLIQKLSKV